LPASITQRSPWPRTIPCLPARVELDRDIAIGKLLFELQHELVDYPAELR